MGQRVGAQGGNHATLFHHHIVGCRETLGHIGARSVGDGEQNVAYLLFGLGLTVYPSGGVGFQGSHTLFGGFGLFAAALLHHCPDARGELLQLRRHRVVGFLKAAALLVESQNFLYGFTAVEAFHLQPFNDMLRICLYVC